MSHWLAKGYWNAFTLWHALDEARLPYRPMDELTAIQNRRVQRMVAHAYATVPYYRDVMDAAGWRPEDFQTAADLTRLPVITSAQVAAAPERFLSRQYATRLGVQLQSSATTGQPKQIRHDAASAFYSMAYGQRERIVVAHFTGRLYGFRELIMYRPTGIQTQLRRFYEAYSWVPRAMDFQRGVFAPDGSFESAVAHINAFQPDVLRGYGSHVGPLFRWAWERNVPLFRPKLVFYGGDSMPDADRVLIERQVGAPVLSAYSAAEALRLAFQCERAEGFHVDVDQVAIWARGDDGKPVGPGGRGEIIFSNLINRATVLLNYSLGDVVTLGRGACACGRTLPFIERVDGRCDDLVALPDGRMLHSRTILRGLFEAPGLVQMQVIQEELRRFRLRAVCAAGTDWDNTRPRLIATMVKMLGDDVVVNVEQVDAIPRLPGGKVRTVISHCSGREA